MNSRFLIPLLLVAVIPLAPAPALAGSAPSFIQELEFRDATVQDAIRVISELTGVNIVATSESGKREFTLFLRKLSVSDAIDSIARVAGLWYRENPKTGVFVVMTTEEYFKDIIVFREENTEVFTLRYQNVVKVARTVQAMFGEGRVALDLQDDFNDDLELPGATLNVNGGGGGIGNTGGRGGNRRRGQQRFNRGFGNGLGGRGGNAGFDGDPKAEIGSMTGEQIRMLEEAQKRRGEDPLLLSERTLASVRKRSRVPIFVSINREHNLLFVRTADDRAMKSVREIVLESDRPTPQVLLEMKVMAISLDNGFKSAFDFSYGSESLSTGPRDGQPANPLQPNALRGPETLLGLVNSDLIPSSSFVFQVMNNKIRARLEILEQEGRVNILATPLLLASNNRPAKIFIGEETVLTTGFTAQTTNTGGGGDNTFIATPVPVTEVAQIGNTLTILPSINADRTVLIRLLQESSRVKRNGARIPLVTGATVTEVPIDTVDISTLEGIVMAKDGLTVVIGGMITETTSQSERKVPFLGDIPLLGYLFKDIQQTHEKEELVLLITPHVFTTPEEAEAISRQRIGELTDPPSGVDVYLDRLDQVRSQSAKGRAVSRAVEAASPVPVSARSNLESSYIGLIRFASNAVRTPRLLSPEDGRIRSVRLKYSGPIALSADVELDTRPTRSWREGALYVTAVKLTNRSESERLVDERRFSGHWLAAAVETPRLEPGATTYAFLISDRPFERAATPAIGSGGI